MKITRRDLLAAIGAGSAAVPFTMTGQQLGPFPGRALLTNLLSWVPQAGDSTSTDSLPLDKTLNATPAWSLDLSGAWRIAKDPDDAGKKAAWYSSGPIPESVEQMLPNPLELAFPGYDGVVWYWRTFDMANPQSFD